MHNYVKNEIYDYISKHYDPDDMTCRELDELGKLSDVAKDLLTSDYYYHVIKAMEDGNDTVSEMSIDEFTTRFKKMYETSDTVTKQTIVKEINKIIA